MRMLQAGVVRLALAVFTPVNIFITFGRVFGFCSGFTNQTAHHGTNGTSDHCANWAGGSPDCGTCGCTADRTDTGTHRMGAGFTGFRVGIQLLLLLLLFWQLFDLFAFLFLLALGFYFWIRHICILLGLMMS